MRHALLYLILRELPEVICAWIGQFRILEAGLVSILKGKEQRMLVT
jgi:hypothetical protein